MSDQFIDALHDRLKNGANGVGGPVGVGAAALTRWWENFVDALAAGFQAHVAKPVEPPAPVDPV